MSEELSDEQYWKKKIKEHMPLFIVIIIAAAIAFIGALLVIIWFIETSPIGAQGTALIGDWSLDWIVGFYILIILWELLFVGLPAGLFFGVAIYGGVDYQMKKKPSIKPERRRISIEREMRVAVVEAVS